jgi:glycosyltransferase involved in cell wall biosynthesis
MKSPTRVLTIVMEPVRRLWAKAIAVPSSLPGAKMLRRLIAGASTGILRTLRSQRVIIQWFSPNLRSKVRSLLEKFAQVRPLPPPAATPAVAAGTSSLLPAINLFGLLDSPTGVGEAARGVVACLETLPFPHKKISVDGRHLFFGEPLAAGVWPDPRFAINCCHLNADCTGALQHLFGWESFAGRYNIAFWAWELDEFPRIWDSALEAYQEIWVPSTFVQQAVAARSRVPVVRMPHCLRMDDIVRKDRAAWGFPQDRPVILCMFDTASFVERKNPRAAIEAVKRAKIAQFNPLLVIKVNQLDLQRGLRKQLEQETRPLDCRILGEKMSHAETLGLIDACDMVVSLHRSEGFGLVLAEAMALGKPVVATGYSGNMDFMTSDNSCPVDFKLVTLRRDVGPYPAGARWAEPDIEHASIRIRELLDNPQRARRIGRQAAADIGSNYSVAAVARQIGRRLDALGFKAPVHATELEPSPRAA